MFRGEKTRYLIIAMCDNISGEDAALSIDCLYRAGAMNVQVFSTLTKKGRPGYTYMIDCDKAHQEAVETCLVQEIGTTGWHYFPTTHRYIEVMYLQKEIILKQREKMMAFTCGCKYSPHVPHPYRPEADSIEEIARVLREQFQQSVVISHLRQHIIEAFQSTENPVVWDIENGGIDNEK